MRRLFDAALTLSLLCVVACHHEAPPPPSAEPRPTATLSSGKTYTDPSSRIAFQYPADWTPGRGKTAIFEASSPDHQAKLSLDIPSLPFHLLGMITAGAVTNGYINDVKKRLAGATVEQNQEITIPDASARRVKITGSDAGAPTTDFAVLIVHADAVYILSSDGAGPAASAAEHALDAAAASLKWKP